MSEAPHNSANEITARIDAPHSVRPALAEAASRPVAVAAGASLFGTVEPAETREPKPLNPPPIDRHAAELAEQLQRRQSDLDRRAAMLGAQEAEIENKIRHARLWIEERQRELDAREEAMSADRPAVTMTAPDLTAEAKALEARQRELDARQADIYRQIEELTQQSADVHEKTERLANREAQLKDLEQSIDRRHMSIVDEREDLALQSRELDERRGKLIRRNEELETRDAELRSRESQMAFRRHEIETAIARFEKLGVTHQRMEELDARSAEFETRSRYLDKAEELLKEDTARLAKRRQELDDEFRSGTEHLRAERQKFIGEQETFRQLVARRTKELDQREGELDQREESLGNLRLELESSQREVLEMRLATEETWAQLTGVLAPASLTRSIAQMRGRLADHYEHQITELAQRRDELEQLRTALAGEHTGLETRRTQFQEWQRRREQEVEQQAGRLIAREQELDRQQMHYEALESKWRLERDDYRAEIRQLLTQLRKGILDAA
ncbi:hypothetical protein [Aeoliella sp. SH292]|uniref:hypothetical protein n=1 Tax=Aeoliella sp. SH292 TaxID=3454464 RepID=UPI003F9EAD2A